MFPWSLQLSNGPVVGSRKRPSEGNYEKEKEHCIALFDQWSEADQVEFVERLISRMCHYQHGHINSYLKPMLQRDFITALPGTNTDFNLLLSRGNSSVSSIFHNHRVTVQLGADRTHLLNVYSFPWKTWFCQRRRLLISCFLTRAVFCCINTVVWLGVNEALFQKTKQWQKAKITVSLKG